MEASARRRRQAPAADEESEAGEGDAHYDPDMETSARRRRQAPAADEESEAGEGDADYDPDMETAARKRRQAMATAAPSDGDVEEPDTIDADEDRPEPDENPAAV